MMNATPFFRLVLAANGRMARRRIAGLREQSWLMVGVILSFVVGYWAASYL